MKKGPHLVAQAVAFVANASPSPTRPPIRPSAALRDSLLKHNVPPTGISKQSTLQPRGWILGNRVKYYGAHLLRANISTKRPFATMTQPTQLDASHEVARLWQALLDGNVPHMRRKKLKKDETSTEASMEMEPAVSTTDTGAFVLPEGLVWLQTTVRGRTSRHLLVRECSFQICDLIDKRYLEQMGGAVVIGTPGIGKSWLTNLLLLRAAQEKRNVIFESVKEEIAYFFNGTTGKVHYIKGPRVNFNWPYADDRNALYIMDAGGKGIHREPLFIKAFTVVLASPNEKHYGQFVKEIGLDARFFMPDWTQEDLVAVLPFVEDREQNGVSTDVIVKDRFYKLGGIPRLIFGTKEGFDDAVDILHKSLRELSSFNLQLLESKDTHWHLVPNYIFTLRSSYPFGSRNTSVARASCYVDEKLPEYLHGRNMIYLEEITLAYNETRKTLLGAPTGLGFEVVCAKNFTVGGQIRLRSLTSQDERAYEVQLEPMPLLAESDVPDVWPRIIYWPRSRNFPDFDGYLLLRDSLILVQSTVSTKRELPFDGVQEFVQRTLSRISTNIKRVEYWYMVPLQEFTTKFGISLPKGVSCLPTSIAVPQVDKSQTIPFQVCVASWVSTKTKQK